MRHIVQLYIIDVYVYNPPNLSPKSHDKVILPCVANGGNRITWRRNGQEIIITSGLEYSGGTTNNPSLTIFNVTRYHSGNYTCETAYGSVIATSNTQLQLNVKGT